MDELLPEQAFAVENLRRAIFDLHVGWGYQPVQPPMVEFLDSLLSTAGKDFDRHTFKVADPRSGRMLGIRADMTPQVARIDAHQLGGQGISRLFYMGTVVRAFSDSSDHSRSPIQLGAELFGHNGIASDTEIIRLMLATLGHAGLKNIHLDLGHVGIFRNLVERLELASTDQAALFDLLQRKAESDLASLAGSLGIGSRNQEILVELCTLNGDESVLERAEKLLGGYGDGMMQSIATLRSIGQALSPVSGKTTVHYDLAELRGYHYHSGVVFAAYLPDLGSEIARGGRYDGIGQEFGRSRPATGYSTDLKSLLRVIDTPVVSGIENAILAPDNPSLHLQATIEQLRASGEIVIVDLDTNQPQHFSRVLREQSGKWSVEKR
ncbi:ATP phosphoribosyltransferase regulatory subunit [Chromatiales bacterium (ex Bugula neritina AB1)]|nr:ATP phosphoribosyltransferase regulatory subunit [Chromatiales bacterium (ex Bugula neritina AB1)]